MGVTFIYFPLVGLSVFMVRTLIAAATDSLGSGVTVRAPPHYLRHLTFNRLSHYFTLLFYSLSFVPARPASPYRNSLLILSFSFVMVCIFAVSLAVSVSFFSSFLSLFLLTDSPSLYPPGI